MSDIFQIQASLHQIRTMSSWIRLSFDTVEIADPEALGRIFSWRDKHGWLTFNIHVIEPDDIVNLPEPTPEERKSPAQRLRGVLYRLWERNNEKYEVFEDYYKAKMEKLIEAYKERLT